jgi:hypothetical protein
MAEGGLMRPRLLPAAALVTAALVTAALLGLAGCDGGTTPGPTGTAAATAASMSVAPEPCTLVTPADLEQVLGETFTVDPAATADDQRRICTYTASETGHVVNVNEYPLVPDLRDLMAAAQDVNQPPTPLTGIGRAAFRTHSQVYVLLDNFVLSIVFLQIAEGDSTDAALETLAKAAAGRA